VRPIDRELSLVSDNGRPSEGKALLGEENTVEVGAAQRREFLSLLVSSAAGVAVVPVGTLKTVTIGRSPACDVEIADESVSRKHAVLRLSSPPTIEDLGSRNGTAVEGRRIEARASVPIAVGTCVELGSTTVALVRARPPAKAGASAAVPSPHDPAIIVEDPTMRRIVAMLDVVARSELSVLLQGETGVGKDVFAAELHRRSRRRDAAFRMIDCAALPESILEGELFGYERGAFTGAVSAKAGLFEVAAGGTVFLDEIAELPLAVQAKLLRVVEKREVMRLGSTHPKVVDIRIVAATNRDLAELVAARQFRADLYFRLNGVGVTLPPLRQRTKDVVPLARHFLGEACKGQGRGPLVLTPGAQDALEAYDWPGNVRELRSVLDRVAVMCSGPELGASDLALPLPRKTAELAVSTIPAALHTYAQTPSPAECPKEPTASLRTQVEVFEKQRVIAALEKTAGNQTRAAQELGVSRGTLIAKIKMYGIERRRRQNRSSA
jgi:transcriptional regulator with GAF, ATPase, and Fis domain